MTDQQAERAESHAKDLIMYIQRRDPYNAILAVYTIETILLQARNGAEGEAKP